jgi:branched-chain amino acid transport system substrate-binding protein
MFTVSKLLSRRRVTTAFGLSLLASAMLLQGCDNSPLNVKIGVAQPLTGNLAPLGNDMLNGVKLAAEELNKEGIRIKGRIVNFEVVAVDDRANADTGKEVAKQLVDAGVVAVIGHLNSGVSIATAPIYADANIAQLAISTNPKYTSLGHDTTFRLVANDTLQAKAIGSFAASQFQATRYAVVDDGTPYGKDLATGAAGQLQQNKKEVVLQKSFDDKTKDFDELAGKLKESKVEVIVSTLSDFQVLALIDALKKVSYTDVRILGGDTLKTPLMLKGAGQTKGLFATSPILEPSEFTAGKAFLTKYHAKYNTDPAYAGHYSYDAMYVLSSAMRRAESVKPKDIVQMLHKIDGYAPVTGSMKWDGKGEQRYGVIGIYSATESQWDPLMRSDSW